MILFSKSLSEKTKEISPLLDRIQQLGFQFYTFSYGNSFGGYVRIDFKSGGSENLWYRIERPEPRDAVLILSEYKKVKPTDATLEYIPIATEEFDDRIAWEGGVLAAGMLLLERLEEELSQC